nr:reverse transcriptase domain-containing protein [Tanacetum cinerariifolium]
MWAADRVVALTLGFAITILETANEIAIKGTIKTWDELSTTFISRFFPPALFDRLLREIRAFSQHENESLTDVWLRMMEMLRSCHGHNLSKGDIIKIFYHGLNGTTQEVLNTATGGIFLYKTPNQAYQLLKDKVLLKLDWAKKVKTKPSLKKTVAFADDGSDTDKIMARMNAMTMKMDAYDDEDDEPTPQPKTQEPKPVKETPIPKPYKPKIPYPQCLRKEKMEAQYEKSLDMIRVVQINIPFFDILAGMPNYGKFLKEIVSNKHKIKQISVAFLGDKGSVKLQYKFPPKLRDPGIFSFHVTSTKLSHFYSNDDTCFSIDVIDEILKGDFDALLNEESKIFHSIEGTILEEKLYAEFDKFMAMTTDENSESESNTGEPPFGKNHL